MGSFPHCKHPDHLGVLLLTDTQGIHGVGETTVSRVDKLQCVNAHGYQGPGALLSPRRKPGEGMHLFPDGAAYLAERLIAAAAYGPDFVVGITHTVQGEHKVWRKLNTAAALEVGNALQALGEGLV